jgi:hypothetical protein
VRRDRHDDVTALGVEQQLGRLDSSASTVDVVSESDRHDRSCPIAVAVAVGSPLPTWLLWNTSSNNIVVGVGDSFSHEAITKSAVAAPSLAVETGHGAGHADASISRRNRLPRSPKSFAEIWNSVSLASRSADSLEERLEGTQTRL